MRERVFSNANIRTQVKAAKSVSGSGRRTVRGTARMFRLNSDIRESMRALPGWTQGFLTWLTGKPFRAQRGTKHSSWYHLFTAVCTLLLGLFLSAAALVKFSFLTAVFLPLGWLFTVSAQRKLQVMLIHYCSHAGFSKHRRVNDLVGDALSFLLLVEPFRSYKRAHLVDHHSTKHMSLDDPTVHFLFNFVGLEAGLGADELKRRFRRALFSPRFYLRVLRERVVAQGRASRIYRTALLLYWLMLFSVAAAAGQVGLLVFGWMFPLFVLYSTSSALRLIVEHVWPQAALGGSVNRYNLAPLTRAVFLGEPTPSPSLKGSGRVIAWTHWTLSMLTVHLWARIFVLVGDTPNHDFHHRFPNSKDWPNASFARQRDAETLASRWPMYQETWGLWAAVNLSLELLSTAKMERGEVRLMKGAA
jgi:fatty acid desaturase